MQANTETARNFSLRPSLPNQLHHQASLLLRTFSCFQSIQLDPLKAIPPFPLTPIPCHTSDPHPLTLGPSLLTLLDAPDFTRLATGNPKSGPALPPGSGGSRGEIGRHPCPSPSGWRVEGKNMLAYNAIGNTFWV